MMNQCNILSSYQCFAWLPWEKGTENPVQLTLKINMDVSKSEEHDSRSRPMISLNFQKVLKTENLQKTKITWKLNFLKKNGKNIVGWRGTLRVLRAETWLTVYRTIANMETVAKPGRLGPAQNDEPMQNFVELSRFCLMTFKKALRKLCRAYVEDQYGCDKI